MRVSARNTLKGIVRKIEPGAVNAEVTLELAGGEMITSVVTMESVAKLELKEGATAYAIIKASNVMLGVDH